MTEPRIVTIPILPMGMINAFLVTGPGGNILVDSGRPNSEERFGRVLNQQGLTWRDIDLIVITHAHADHAGSAFKLQQLCQAPLVAHEADLPYYHQEKAMTYCPTSRFASFFLKTGIPLKPYEKFTPDILLKGNDTLDLAAWGVNGTVYSTPGHTEGSISVALSNRSALAGDLVASGILLGGIMAKDRARPPVYEDNAQQVAGELNRLLDKGMETFYLGHGGPLSSREVRRYANTVLQSGQVPAEGSAA